MEESDKKEEKLKAGKKKEAQKADALTGISEQLERAFNKKMKALVKEVKKETKKEIKELIKQARQRIKVGAAEIAEALLKAAKTEAGNNELADQKQAATATQPEVITSLETTENAPNATTPTIDSAQKTSSRSKKIINTAEEATEPKTSTRTRKTSAARKSKNTTTETA